MPLVCASAGRAAPRSETSLAVGRRPDPARRFLDLHRVGDPLLLANPWDAGFAKLLAAAGFQALATTSSGHAGSLGRRDGGVTCEEALAHAASIVQATEVPVNADLENGFASDAEGVAETARQALATGVAGFSIEDATGRKDDPIFARDVATARIEAAAAASAGLVLTARAENYVYGIQDLGDTIARLQAFQEAGADVLYAPGVVEPGEIRTLIESVDRPVNVLMLSGGLSVAELGRVGAARISVGGAFHGVAFAAVDAAARELLEQGTAGYLERARAGVKIRNAF
ncbi:MAG: isocitrate lyase/phosphoenolpyruvate mutase family protein [Deltaproteobacteria bacterium]|nr:isocitrate lyase/phosphoenolpyruvate mutase family protein [Deltaproteobacteria bacterium]MBW2446652.1 isocitrate lyase/phosphoenolpyruvate mutase family protein [Deltaproteobacteria bacterium]